MLLQNKKIHQICSILVSKYSACSNYENKYPHFMFLTINNSYWSLNLPSHASFSPLLNNVSFHKQTVRASSSRMSISACVFLTGKRETRPWYSFGLNIFIHISIYSNIQIYILQYNHDGIQKKSCDLYESVSL